MHFLLFTGLGRQPIDDSSAPEVIKLFTCSTQLNMKILKAHKYENNKNFGFFWLR